ncbi:hypothetical protein CPCC7001_1234 [Cyanobium sp. PCC 7001]|uniref:hypothetical protein n=1 Tax=Cyanobium sp. PCC 7001 TaxID=180281 RepID=UPI0001804DD3|nr:hypothetical protein [Cyanobium sp. PCC 7001]EDY38355.1 hypothetical protein CPCC7001_1234 [Cyanobium sp. PCC 7001]
MKPIAIVTLMAATITSTAGVMVARPAQANQPNMKAALVNLKQAKQSLEQATHDKGGHRVKAIQLINEAIEEVKKGIDSGRM